MAPVLGLDYGMQDDGYLEVIITKTKNTLQYCHSDCVAIIISNNTWTPRAENPLKKQYSTHYSYRIETIF